MLSRLVPDCRESKWTGNAGLPLVREKSGKFKVREKSGNFRICQGNLEFCWKSGKLKKSQGNLRKFIFHKRLWWSIGISKNFLILISCVSGNPAMSYPRSPNLCPEAVVDCVGLVHLRYSFNVHAFLPLRGCSFQTLKGRLLIGFQGFNQCANIQALITWSITAFVHKIGGCGYDDGELRTGVQWIYVSVI